MLKIMSFIKYLCTNIIYSYVYILFYLRISSYYSYDRSVPSGRICICWIPVVHSVSHHIPDT